MKRIAIIFLLDLLLTLTASAQSLPANPKTPGIDPNSTVVQSYVLSYYVADTLYYREQLRVGSPVTPPASPTRDGYLFTGWSGLPVTMPGYDVSVTASFERHFDVSHLVRLLNFIMQGNATDADMSLFDINEDGELNVGDVVLAVKNILENDDNE